MRAIRALAVAAIMIALGSGSYALVRNLSRAELQTEQNLPPDVRTEVDETWAAFLDVFARRQHCFDDVSLLLVNDLDEGDARYVISEARIEIKIPTSPRRFRESLVHELAHHVEHTCEAFGPLKADFLALSGVGDTWSTGERWQDIPAELWAESVVAIVNNERVRHERTMPLPDGAPELVRSWAVGDHEER